MSTLQPLGAKAPDAFRTISEVAEELDIPQHVLRFWETRFSSIRPLKRGGGRRYYRPDDVDLLKGIRHLLYGQGYTIKGVQRILKEEGPRGVQTIGRSGEMPTRQSPLEAEISLEGSVEHPASYAAPHPALAAPEQRREYPNPAAPVGFLAHEVSSAANDFERLRGALAELVECRRIIEALRRQ